VIDPPVQLALRSLLDALETLLLDRLRQEEKRRSPDVSPEEAGRLIITFARGIVAIEGVYQDKAPMLATANSLIALLLQAPARAR
jgi:TetR/AcrR family transcriptional regulator, transcriptional repressor for nem operon